MNKPPRVIPVVSRFQGRATNGQRLALVALLLPAVSWAQLPPQQAPAPVEQIIVTGTRLADPNAVSSSPIQVVTSREIAISGKNDAFDILQMLPQNLNNDLGQDLGNRTSGLTTPGGVATADLRGLGPNRTLVLVNGRRIGNGSPNTAISSPAPDLDQIPSRLIERVEVVTGGASAVYGSDAVAGVVNFITKTNFEGIEFDAQTGFNVHDNNNGFAQQVARDAGFTPASGTVTDGRNANYSLIGGTNTANGKGNFTVFLGYTSQDGVQSGNRDFGAGQLFTDTDDDGVPLGTASMGGSSNSNYFRPRSGPQANGAVYSVLGNSFVPRSASNTALSPPAVYNSQKLIYMSRQYKRATAGLIGHYDLNEHIQPYVEFGYTNDRTHQEIAPSALFRSSNPLSPDTHYLINCSNPLLSTQQRNILCSPGEITADTAVPGSALAHVEIGRRNVEGGQRYSDFEHSNYRAVGGLRGEIGPAWSYDAYAQYYYVQFYNTNNRYLNFQSIENALQVTGTAAAPACIKGPPCVPYNIFKDGGVTQDALDYLYTNGTAYGTNSLRTVHADFTADLGHYGLKLRSASEGVSLNVGYETRREAVVFNPDSAELSGLLSGFAGASVAIDRAQNVDEVFAEIRVPLLGGKKHVKDLSLDAGFRNSDYSTSGSVGTSKFEIQYAPSDAVRLRTSLNRAIRAPSLIELYNPQFIGQITIGNDPCAPTTSAGGAVVAAVNSLQQCLRTVSAAQAAAFTAAYGNGGTTNSISQGTASQLSQVQGGNPLLKPEIADTYSIGVTLTPAALKNFTASVDLWHVKIDKEVGTLPAGVILNGCPVTGDPVFCSQLVRNPQTFSLQGASVSGGGYILQTSTNIAGAETGGIDLQGVYRLDFQKRGSLTFAWAASHQLTNKSTPYVGAHTYDCSGLFGLTCQTVNPTWRHVFRTTWATPKNISATLTWRHISAVSEDNNDSDPTLHFSAFAGVDTFNGHISAQNYFDLAATYQVKKIELRGGINNLLDKEPPMLGSEIVGGGAPNTYSTYDMFGREIFVALNVKF